MCVEKRKTNLDEDTQRVIRAIGVSHTACQDEFRQNIFDLTALVYLHFSNICIHGMMFSSMFCTAV